MISIICIGDGTPRPFIIGFYFIFGTEGIIFALALSYIHFSLLIYKGLKESSINFSSLKAHSGVIPNNYVIATSEFHTLEDFLNVSFKEVGIDDWSKYVKQDERYMRPADVFYLRGDSSRANEELGWKPKTSFNEMVSKMLKNDIKLNDK